MTQQEAVEHIVGRYGPVTYRLAILMTGSPAVAEAISREVLTMIVQHAGTTPDEAGLDDVVLRRTATAAHAVLRSQRSATERAWGAPRAAFDVDGRAGGSGRDWTGVIEGPEALAEAQRRIRDGLNGLPPDDRIALVLHDVQGVEYGEVAEILGFALPAVKLSVHRSRLWLRQALAEAFDPRATDRGSRDG